MIDIPPTPKVQMTTLLDNLHVSPTTAPKTELTLPLTFFDHPWIHFVPIRRLVFYKFTGSKADFVNTTIPQLKQSLSLTLKHYLPLAGNLLYPINVDEDKPVIRYNNGDYVNLTIAESMKDFNYLTGYEARGADEFYDFVPKLPPGKEENGYKLVPVLALQVTIFPGEGICIGFSNLHVVGDAGSIFQFIKAWSSINKMGGDEQFVELKGELLPIFDRTVLKVPIASNTMSWDALNRIPFKPDTFSLPTERVRATFVLQESDIKRLKQKVMSKNPDLGFVSSFVVATAYAWTSFLKSGEESERDEMFLFVSDIRARVDPPVPANYFGNFLGFGNVIFPWNVLVGDEGFVQAAKVIAEVIKNRLNKKDEVLKGAENWTSDFRDFFQRLNVFGISGSPKFDLYGVDFGWGSGKKVEVVTIDSENHSMFLCKSRDFEGGLEVGLSLPKGRMDKFSAIFQKGLEL